MNRKRLVKKILALGSGLTMLGATIMGATASLEAYPTQFVRDGVFTGKIVVGKNAATSDVLGAIDIAASLQAASTVDTPVEVPGAVGKTSFNGDALEWSLPNDLLSLGEPLGDVRQTVTDQELNSLKGGVVTTDLGSTQYNQYLRFRTTGAQNLDKLQNGSSGDGGPSGSYVVFGKNDDPVQKVGDFLFFQEGTNVTRDTVFEYELEFQQGLQSSIKSRNGKFELRDLRDEVFNIFGQDFVFVDSTIKGNDSDIITGCNAGGVVSPTTGTRCGTDLELDFLGGDVTDVLQEGETKTYTIDGIDYEVTAVFLANPNQGTQTAKFSVNGELTQELQAGDTDTLSDGLQIGVQELLTNDRGGLVEFFLGANKIVFRDTNTRDSVTNGANLFNGFHNGVTIANEIIEDAWVQITGSFIDSNADGVIQAGEKFQIQDIKYRLLADALTGTSNIYIAPGHGLREFLDEPAGMLNPNWDIRYEGFYDVGSTPVKIAARADDEYWLEFTNRQGNYYNIPLVEISQSGTFRYGRDETRDFIVKEPEGFTGNLTAGGGMNQSNGQVTSADDRSRYFPIGRKDTFVLTNSIKNNGQDIGSNNDPYDDTAFTHVLEYEAIDTSISNQVVTFEDLALGPKEVKYTLGCVDCQSAVVGNMANQFILGQFQLVVGGNTFKGYILNQSTGAKGGAFPIALDLNGDGTIDGDKARVTVKGGGVVDLGNNTGNFTFGNMGAVLGGVVATPTTAQSQAVGLIVNVTTLSRDFDEPNGGPESVEINLTRRASINQVSVNNVQYRRNHVLRTTTTIPAFTMTRPDEVRDHLYAATEYGVLIDEYKPTSQTIPEEITLDYPNSMRGVQVYVTAGKVQAQKTSGGGAFTTTQLNPIAVGLAVLDVDAGRMLGNTPLIVVGGPCANSVAAQLMGNPANCGAGFEPGKAMIKWFPDKMALLVAGYEAQETLGGSYVLADYKNPAYAMQGNEVEVVVADLNSITVKPVQ